MKWIMWLVEHWDVVSAIVGAVVSVLLATKWGMANRAALQAVVDAVERRSADDVKGEVRAVSLKPSARDALGLAVALADQKKTPESKGRRALRFVKRAALGILLRRFG